MGKTGDNLKKTKLYLKRNGVKKTFFAATERFAMEKRDDYTYELPDEAVLQSQREQVYKDPVMISILVPTYNPDPSYFREMMQSVMQQTYQYLELVIADASTNDNAQLIVLQEQAKVAGPLSIQYVRITENKGIAENTNVALRSARGEYIGLLDHDDCLTPDALWSMAEEINRSHPVMLYSDEDKTDASATVFSQPHRKKKLNLDLLLTNNYICHFCVIRADIMKRLEFRDEYEGAQDYDMVLRTVATLENPKEAVHIPKVLYHWRCHDDSTAANPESKQYAYESGRRAVVDFCMQRGWNVRVEHSQHLGFYKVEYIPDLFAIRTEVGVVGGAIVKGGKIVSGAMHSDGTVIYAGLPKMYSGYMNRASLCQEVSALDLRNLMVREELKPLLSEFMETAAKEGKTTDWKQQSLAFCERVRMQGYHIVYDPTFKVNKDSKR